MKKRITVVSSLLVIAALLVSCAPSVGQATTVAPTVAATKAAPVVNLTTVAEQDAFVQLYTMVNPSVVDIRVVEKAAATTQDTQYTFPNIPGFPQFNYPQQQQNAAPAQVEGAGFIYDSAGHIVTNNHVVENADRIVVTFSDGTQVDAKLVGTDPGTDLAVIQVSGVDSALVKPVTLADSTQLKVGQLVVAIGSPFMLQGTMTTGIISALGRTLLNTNSSSSQTISANQAYYSIPDMIQTDAAINHGNSGGPLVDLSGQVVGVNTAIASTSDSNAGIGYAIPSSVINLVVGNLISTGKAEHTYLGINPTEMTPDLATAMNLPANTRGILILAASATGPAGKAGIQGSTKDVTIDGVPTKVGGDIITSIDGNTIKTYNELVSYLLLHTKTGQVVSLGVIRDGKDITVKATLEVRPANS